MLEMSTVRSPALRHRRATIMDALWAAPSRGSAWLIAAIANELRVRRDMRKAIGRRIREALIASGELKPMRPTRMGRG